MKYTSAITWWKFQLLFFIIKNISANEDPCGNNTFLRRQQCTCFSSTHVHCPGVFTATVTSDTVPSHMAIQCHNSDPLPADVIPFQNIRAVVMTDCVFGNHSLLGNAENLTDLSIYCRPGLNYVLSPNQLEGLSNLKLLHIWCPGLNLIDKNSFKLVSKSLTHLTIRGSLKLNNLDERLFENMQQLVTIRIKDNSNLIKLPTYLFNGLKQLKSLYLDHNSIKILHVKTFYGLDQLTDLSLAGNGLLVLEPDQGEVEEQKLVLLGQVELPHALYYKSDGSQNESLIVEEKENITRRKREESNVSLFQNLQSLTELKLDFNVLPTLKSLNNLKKLRRLSLRSCGITEINTNSLQGLINLETIDLSLNTINEIPAGFLQPTSQSLQTLILTENLAINLTLASSSLSNLLSVREVNLSRSGIRDIPIGTFSDFKNLKSIDLSNNYLNELPRGIFQSSNDIELLNLSNNILTNIPSDILEGLENLKHLDVSGNVLSRVPPNLFSDTRDLLRLDFQGNKLRTLGSLTLLGLARTQHLDLANNVIATVDPETFSNMAASARGSRTLVDLRNFTRSSAPRPMTPHRHSQVELRNLSLANNRLNLLPARVFASLGSLQVLDLSNNSLTALPALNFLHELRELWVAGNRLRELQAPLFVDSSRLQSLSLRNNFVNEVPPSLLMGLGSTLTSLDLSHNSLSQFPSAVISGLDSLETLDLSHNKLRSVDFSSLRTLRHADLAHNALTFKESGWVFFRTAPSSGQRGSSSGQRGSSPGQWGRQATFGNCSSLQSINLANNSMTDVLLDLRRLEGLRMLDLSHNSLTSLESRDLQFASCNLTVDLRHNQVTSVKLRDDDLSPPGPGDQVSVKILLEDNPISCDCRLPNLLRYLFGDSRLRLAPGMHAAEIVAGQLACHLPPSVRGKRLLEVETWGHYLLPLLGLCHVFQ